MALAHIWEGSWEEIARHAAQFAGTSRRVTLIVTSEEEEGQVLPDEPFVAAPNEQMQAILRDIEQRHQDRPFTDGAETQRLLEQARAGAMYGGAASGE